MTQKVYEAICSITEEMSKVGIAKNRKNQQQGYSFRGIDDFLNAIAPLLAKYKLCILPRVVSKDVNERMSAKGGVLFYTTVHMEFDFVSAEDGSKHTVVMVGEAMDSADKSSNKSMSAAYKYAVMQTFCIPTEGDNDADSTTHEVAHEAMSEDQTQRITEAAEKAGLSLVDICKLGQVKEISEIPSSKFPKIMKWLETKVTE